MSEESSSPAGPRRIRLRYAGTCEGCGSGVAKGTDAWYDPAGKKIRCDFCYSDGSEPEPRGFESGTAGGSALREHDRRAARYEKQLEAKIAADTEWRTTVKKEHPIVGRLAAALTAKPEVGPEPQRIAAWKAGADGEQKVGRRLDDWAAAGEGRIVLHDRRIPKTKANIDHLALGPSGVWVIDAKEYAGRIEQENAGGIFRPDWRLKIGGRDRSKLAEGVRWQVEIVQAALASLSAAEPVLPVRGVLCFVGAEWSLFAKPFDFGGIAVAWPLAAVEILSRPGDLSSERVSAVASLSSRSSRLPSRTGGERPQPQIGPDISPQRLS